MADAAYTQLEAWVDELAATKRDNPGAFTIWQPRAREFIAERTKQRIAALNDSTTLSMIQRAHRVGAIVERAMNAGVTDDIAVPMLASICTSREWQPLMPMRFSALAKHYPTHQATLVVCVMPMHADVEHSVGIVQRWMKCVRPTKAPFRELCPWFGMIMTYAIHSMQDIRAKWMWLCSEESPMEAPGWVSVLYLARMPLALSKAFVDSMFRIDHPHTWLVDHSYDIAHYAANELRDHIAYYAPNTQQAVHTKRLDPAQRDLIGAVADATELCPDLLPFVMGYLHPDHTRAEAAGAHTPYGQLVRAAAVDATIARHKKQDALVAKRHAPSKGNHKRTLLAFFDPV